MATVLSISSQVVRGAVGNSASTFPLQRMGHTVLQLPTTLLSNHPGHGALAGGATDIGMFTAWWQAIVGHGWHKDIDAVLTGYMPTNAHADATSQIVREVRAVRDDALYLCDPAIGDDPTGLYVPEDAAVGVRDLLLPLADIATPNRFELSWLSGQDDVEAVCDVVNAARVLKTQTVVATSIPSAGNEEDIANFLCSADKAFSCSTPCLLHVAKGTGDLFGAMYLGSILNRNAPEHALGFATAAVREILLASSGHDMLRIVSSQDAWSGAQPASVVEVTR